MPKLTALLAALALATPALAAPLSGAGASSAPSAQAAKKKCKRVHGKKRCKKKPAPSPYFEGQLCDPSQAKAYARYDFLCLPQPQPDGTTNYQLVKSLA